MQRTQVSRKSLEIHSKLNETREKFSTSFHLTTNKQLNIPFLRITTNPTNHVSVIATK